MAFKVCTGPAHAGPTRLPVDEENWYFHRSGPRAGQPTTRCKLCVNWSKLVNKDGPHGFVRVTPKIRSLAKELADRCDGYPAVERLHGIRGETLRVVVAGEQSRLQKKTVARLLSALAEQRKEDRRNGTSERFNKARKIQAAKEERLLRMDGCG